MSALSFKGPLQPPSWWPEAKQVVAKIILGPDRPEPRPKLPDTAELARDGKISDWLRVD